MSALIQKAPSVMRYDRVQTILSAEPIFRDRLGPKQRSVVKRNKEEHLYSTLVIDVTDAIHKIGLDAYSVPKPVVLRVAADVCAIVETTKPKPKPKPKPKAKKPPITKLPQAEQPDIVPDESEVVAVYSNLSKLSLCVSLRQLMQLDDDKFPGFEKRREAIDFLITEYNRIKSMPTQLKINDGQNNDKHER